METLLFAVTYTSALTLPGFAVCQLAQRHRIGYSPLAFISLSYLIFALLFIAANNQAIPSGALKLALGIIVLISFIYLLSKSAFRDDKDWVLPTTSIGLLSLLYQLILGAYSEVPADAYAHLERIQSARLQIDSDSLGAALSWKQLLQQGSGVYYYLVALIDSPFGLTGTRLFEALDFLNRTLFLTGVFFFSKQVFRASERKITIAYLAVVFVALHMGINVFSFVRYYSLAPSILALVLYFYAASLFVDIITKEISPSGSGLRAFLIFCLMIGCAAIHVQEAMFIAITVTAISIIAAIFAAFPTERLSPQKLAVCIGIVAVAAASFAVIYIYSHLNLTRAPNSQWRLWEFGEGFGIFPQLTILNLKYQFIRVTTLWGLLVYFLFFLNIKRYRENYFVLAGMLSPLITFLNPFFIDLFLRHYNSTTIWRTCYLIPLHFVAADLFIFYLSRLRSALTIRKRTFSACILFLMMSLLTPIKNTWNSVHYSRFPTLYISEQNSSYVNYTDLLKHMEAYDNKEMILTDPMTGYMISALTKHESERRKFFRDHRYKRFSFYDYSNNPLHKYSGKLLVVNQRPKTKSKIGRIAGHWRENEWESTKNYYPPELLQHLAQNPTKFSKVWAENQISVYRIN